MRNASFKVTVFSGPGAVQIDPLMAGRADSQTLGKIGQARSYAALDMVGLIGGAPTADLADRVLGQELRVFPIIDPALCSALWGNFPDRLRRPLQWL